MRPFEHSYPFDPSYGFDQDSLLAIVPPEPPADFADFWRVRYEGALEVDPAPTLHCAAAGLPGTRVMEITYLSTDEFPISGWLVVPLTEPVERGMVIGHGYGGREGPDPNFALPGAAVLYPCFRGLSRSGRPPISQDPQYHVLHDIDNRDRYLIGGCVEDLWTAVSVLRFLYPAVSNRVGYMGSSFGGGIGALGVPWDGRIARTHLHVPTFGNRPLCLPMPNDGCLNSVREFQERHGTASDTLPYYDAASAARFLTQPAHVAAALFDPVVPPPGQFSIHNALAGDKRLLALEAGHFEHPRFAEEEARMRDEVRRFFDPL